MKLVGAVIILLVMYVIQKVLYKKYWNKSLEMSMSFSRDFIECGESAELIEVISNDKLLPLPVFNLKFSVDKRLSFLDTENSSVTDLYHKNEVFSIMGHQRITRRLKFTGLDRGVVGINNASILVHDLFMTDNYASKISHTDVIYVFPKKLNTKIFDLSFKGILGEIEAKRSLVEDSMIFRGIREYHTNDSYGSINWKKSAAAGKLMVNMHGYTTDCRVRLMLNLDNDYMIEANKLLEEAISLTSSFTRSFLNERISVSMVTNGTDKNGMRIPDIGEGAEKRHGITIDRALSEIVSTAGKDEFLKLLDKELRNVKKDVMYLIISPYAKPDLVEKLDEINRRGGLVSLIVPYYDEFPFSLNKDYFSGWEVPLNV